MVKTVLIILGSLAAILLAFLLSIVLMFITWSRHSEKVREEGRKIVKTYPSEIEKKLEEKYDKKFIIDPKFIPHYSGPIPFARDSYPYVYIVKEDGEEGYTFRVSVYPKSAEDRRIKEITDNYYWKTIGKETKEYMEDNLKGFLPKEYKIVFLANDSEEFDNVKLSLPMEAYCSNLEYAIGIRVWIVAPPENEVEDERMTKENVYPIIKNFYEKNHENIWINFLYFNAASDEDYNRLNTSEFEASMFQKDDEYSNILHSLNLINRFEVKIK